MIVNAPAPGGQKRHLINLIRGWPSPHLLPASLLQDAANTALADRSVTDMGLQYGPDPGWQPLREELAKFLNGWFAGNAAGGPGVGAWNRDPDPERLCITGGASQNVANIMQSFTDPARTRAVWCVAPTYHLMCAIFEDAGFTGRLRAVPEDEEGVDLEALERGLKAMEETEAPANPIYKPHDPSRKIYRHVIYVVPTCSNPSGKTMTLQRREGLVRLARRHDALVICDDVYDFLQWSVPTARGGEDHVEPRMILPRLCDIDASLDGGPADPFGHAISNGSFSKIVSPGVRTGWAEGTRAFAYGLAQTGSTKSGGAPSQLSAVLIAEMLRSGTLDAHIRHTVRPALRRRHGLISDAVRRWLIPLGVTAREEGIEGSGTYGGYFVWLTLPDSFAGGGGAAAAAATSAEEVAARAMREENLVIAAGNMFEVKGDERSATFDRNIRLCYSWVDEADVVDGVERLGRVLKRMQDGVVAPPSLLGGSSVVYMPTSTR